MTDIQQARDVLAKWRRLTSPDPWKASGDAVRDTAGDPIVDYADVQNLEARRAALANVQLIVGTAGNPELWDAIEAMLNDAQHYRPGNIWNPLIRHVERIAAVIIAAEERMTS